jgi:hypothetical protein
MAVAEPTRPQEAGQTARAVYSLQGTLLEACSCGVLCPCWIGEDPDQGTCEAFLGYHFDKGQIEGVDVSGLNMVMVARIPGNVMIPKTWRIAVFVDSKATDQQQEKILAAYTGQLGGPLADMAQFVGEVLGVERVDIEHTVSGGAGSLRVAGGAVEAEMEPYKGGDGTITTLRDSVFSTVPGSPAYVSKASRHKVKLPQYGFEWEFSGRNAIQADYRIEHVA